MVFDEVIEVMTQGFNGREGRFSGRACHPIVDRDLVVIPLHDQILITANPRLKLFLIAQPLQFGT